MKRRIKMLLLAFVPGIVLFLAVWKFDKVEKESPKLLLKLFVSGVLVMLLDILIRTAGLRALEGFYDGSSILLFKFIDIFLLAALIEEGGKFLVLRILTWKNREFNYTFDALVYAVTVSVGFLTAENITYLIKYGSSLNPVRLLLPILSQVLISVLMGYFFGMAKLSDSNGDAAGRKIGLLEAVIIPVMLHGLHELCVSTGETLFIVLFVIYVVVLISFAMAVFIKMYKDNEEIEWREADMDKEDPFEIDVTSLLHKDDAGKEAGDEG